MKIYLASSWRNETYTTVLAALRSEGYEVYDFRDGGFMWSEIGVSGASVDFEQMGEILESSRVQTQFEKDLSALEGADVVVCVLPCGRSAHMELGFAVGMNVPTVLVWADGEPDVMHLMCDSFVRDTEALLEALKVVEDEIAVGTSI